ncbi:MAG: hypothetical protein V3T53_06645 [Phycisphaerales bacterium]
MQAGVGKYCEVRCCGPGALAARQGVQDSAITDGPIILAGLAGSLREDISNGSAYVATRVIDGAGHAWHPPGIAKGNLHGPPGPTIISTVHTITTTQDKRALAERSGADLVDLESAAFAEAASAAGRRWAIVRGVSDGLDDALPEDIGEWVDEQGRTRTSAVIAAILRRPALVGEVRRLRADSIEAMNAVAEVIDSMLSA